MFSCRSCQREAFLFRNVCRECGPELHAAYEESRTKWYARFDRYTEATGKHPLADWDAFEAWMEHAGAVSV